MGCLVAGEVTGDMDGSELVAVEGTADGTALAAAGRGRVAEADAMDCSSSPIMSGVSVGDVGGTTVAVIGAVASSPVLPEEIRFCTRRSWNSACLSPM